MAAPGQPTNVHTIWMGSDRCRALVNTTQFSDEDLLLP